MNRTERAARTVPCPYCAVRPGQPCQTRGGYERRRVHAERWWDALAADVLPLDAGLPAFYVDAPTNPRQPVSW